MPPNTTLLTVGEVAEEFRLDGETVRRWARSGRIKAVRLPGGQWRFRREDIEKILSDAPADAGP